MRARLGLKRLRLLRLRRLRLLRLRRLSEVAYAGLDDRETVLAGMFPF